MNKFLIKFNLFFCFYFLFQSQLFSNLFDLDNKNSSDYYIQKTMAKLPNYSRKKKKVLIQKILKKLQLQDMQLSPEQGNKMPLIEL